LDYQFAVFISIRRAFCFSDFKLAENYARDIAMVPLIQANLLYFFFLKVASSKLLFANTLSFELPKCGLLGDCNLFMQALYTLTF